MISDRDLAREALAEWARGHIADAHEKELEFDERLLGAVARAIGRGREGCWRPIEGAPRDGSEALIHTGTGFHLATWSVGDGAWFNGELLLSDDMGGLPTHWMPLPEVPR